MHRRESRRLAAYQLRFGQWHNRNPRGITDPRVTATCGLVIQESASRNESCFKHITYIRKRHVSGRWSPIDIAKTSTRVWIERRVPTNGLITCGSSDSTPELSGLTSIPWKRQSELLSISIASNECLTRRTTGSTGNTANPRIGMRRIRHRQSGCWNQCRSVLFGAPPQTAARGAAAAPDRVARWPKRTTQPAFDQVSRQIAVSKRRIIRDTRRRLRDQKDLPPGPVPADKNATRERGLRVYPES